MEWANGKWVHSSRDTSAKSKSEKQPVHSDGVHTDKNLSPHEDPMVVKEKNGQLIRISAGTLGPCEKDSQIAGSEKAYCISMTHSHKSKKQTICYVDAVSSRPSGGLNEEEVVPDAALSPETCKSIVTRTAALDTSGDLDTSAFDHEGKSSLKQSEDMNHLSDSTNTKGDYEKHPVARKQGRPRKPQVVVEGVEEIVEITPTGSDSVKSFGQVVIGLTNDDKFSNSRAANSRQFLKAKKSIVDEGKQLSASANPSESRAASSGQPPKVKKGILDEGKQWGNSADPENVETGPQKEGIATNMKRKRGRPPKVVFTLDNPKTNEAVAESVENKRQLVDVEGSTERLSAQPAAVVEPLAISNTSSPSNSRTDVNIVSEQFKRLRDLRRLSLGKSTGKRQVRKHKMISIEASVEPANTCVSKGKNLKSIMQAEFPTQDASDNSNTRTAKHPDNGVFRDSAVLTVTSSNASDDDRPLSAWLEGAHSPPANDKSHFVENGEIRDGVEIPCGKVSENKVQAERDDTSSGNNDASKRHETPVQSSAIMPSENQELPFAKNSLIWGVIESMEVFKRIPQNPHFFPLYNCKEQCREGLAIGSMVTFSSLAERIARACFDDPMNLFDGYLEALVDLEELGFNVTPVRELLQELISIKNRYEQAQNTSKEVESQIMEREQEKSKIGNEIAELEKKIMELKEKQAVAVSKKERKDAEIALLQSSVDAVKESLGSAQDEFDEVTASLW